MNGTRPVGLLAVLRVFLVTGATTFGGMWAATRKLERDLVERAGWLPKEELRASFMLATLIPAPRFLGLAGLVGFRVRGWVGAFVGALGLILPASLLVVTAAALVGPDLLAGPLEPLTRAITIAVVGVLLANAYDQLRSELGTPSSRRTGLVLSAAILGSVVLGLPLMVAAVAGFVVGALLLRPDPLPDETHS